MDVKGLLWSLTRFRKGVHRPGMMAPAAGVLVLRGVASAGGVLFTGRLRVLHGGNAYVCIRAVGTVASTVATVMHTERCPFSFLSFPFFLSLACSVAARKGGDRRRNDSERERERERCRDRTKEGERRKEVVRYAYTCRMMRKKSTRTRTAKQREREREEGRGKERERKANGGRGGGQGEHLRIAQYASVVGTNNRGKGKPHDNNKRKKNNNSKKKQKRS